MNNVQVARVVVVGLVASAIMAVALAFMAFAVGVALASEIREKVELELMPMPVDSGAMGQTRLELRERDDEIELRAEAKAEGLVEDVLYSLCVDDMLIDDEEADDQGRVVLDEDENVTLTTLEDVMVSIRIGLGCNGTVVLHAMVTGDDIGQ